MANLKSTLITSRDAGLGAVVSVCDGAAGIVRHTFQKITTTTSEDATHVLRFVEVPSNARVLSVKLWCAALAGSSAGDVGLYRKSADGGAVVDADFFGSAVSFVSAVNGTEISHESTVNTIAKRSQPLWQAAGLSADPKAMFDVAVTITTDINTGGDIGLEVEYVI